MSQPNSPAPLSQQDQDALVKQIGIALIRSAPPEWRHIDADFRAVGRHFELSSRALDASGRELPWTPAQDTAMVFARLRAGMHGETGGTWFNAHYTIEHPSSYNLEFDRNEPTWNAPPPPQAYRDELRYFPRPEEHVPEWLMRRLAGLAPERQERHEHKFRIARIFDRPGPDGRPTVDRPEVDAGETERLLNYLERSTMILPMRGRDLDRLATDGRQAVPVAFHSDGTWIWPAAVGYYLRTYGVPPEPGLVEHAREHGFTPADIDEQTAGAAAANITGGRPAPPPAPAKEQPPEAEPAPVEPPPPAAEQAGPGGPEPGEQPLAAAVRVPDPAQTEEERSDPAPAPAPPVTADDQPVFARLRETLDGLGIPDSAYRIGEPPAPRTWYLERVTDGWHVGWYEREFATPVLFDEAGDAAAFLLGKLLLEHAEEGLAPSPAGPAAHDHHRGERRPPEVQAPEPERAHEAPPSRHAEQPARQAHDAGEPERHAQEPRPAVSEEGAQAPEWSIRPLPGEPPLTLFHKKRIVELPAGAEIDRHGDTAGNLGYEVGTPFHERSLPPDWELREYHVYRLQQPVVALAGEAIPWFEQPGGGLAYLLPQSIQELLDTGDLAEVVLENPGRH